MKVETFPIAGVVALTPDRFGDDRGFFSETWSAARFEAAGVAGPFVQDNQSLSRDRFVVRGMHCQVGPNAQGKLIRCLRGAILDIAVDARRASPTFGQFVARELSAANWTQLWVPVGFLHGFCTLEPDTEVAYKVTAPYDRDAERGALWNDPALALPWPMPAEQAVLSAKDKVLPRWSELGTLFD